jgi:hypothetical protein
VNVPNEKKTKDQWLQNCIRDPALAVSTKGCQRSIMTTFDPQNAQNLVEVRS